MIIMSVGALDELERVCRSSINYRACIYCESSIRALAIQEALLTAWQGTNFGRYFGGGLAVRFPETNSVVRIMEPQDLRATALYSCHEAIADCDVQLSEDTIQRLDRLVVDYELPIYDHVVTGGLLKSNHIYVNEFSTDNGPIDDDWEWTIHFENGSKITAIHGVPDLGEITPSPDILEYIGGFSGLFKHT